ncbi:MAG: MBL fold metallo-hydrolase [Candidatus Levyibacteriota bacterium]
MKISKYLHSCLLIEDKDQTVLIDPSNFTAQEKALDVTKLHQLDYILITHEHQDHCYPPLIKDMLKKFPKAIVISNESVAKLLKKESIPVTMMGTEQILLEEVAHERLWDTEVPQNTMFHLFGRLTHPGDSHHIQKTNDILALPLEAPWGSMRDAVNLALKLKPKFIIPIHDYLLKDTIRQMMYQRLEAFFKEKNIIFKSLETGKVITI